MYKNQELGQVKYLKVIKGQKKYLIEDFENLNDCYVFATKDETLALREQISNDYYNFEEFENNNYINFSAGFPLDDYDSFKIIKPEQMFSMPFIFNTLSSITPTSLNKNFDEIKKFLLYLQNEFNVRGVKIDSEVFDIMLPKLKEGEVWYRDKQGWKGFNVGDIEANTKTFWEEFENKTTEVIKMIEDKTEEEKKELDKFTEEKKANIEDAFETEILKGKTEITEHTNLEIERINITGINGKLTKVNTIEQLKSINFQVGEVIEVLGYYFDNDGTAHKRIISDSDNGFGVKLNNGLWANIIIESSTDLNYGKVLKIFDATYSEAPSTEFPQGIIEYNNEYYVINYNDINGTTLTVRKCNSDLIEVERKELTGNDFNYGEGASIIEYNGDIILILAGRNKKIHFYNYTQNNLLGSLNVNYEVGSKVCFDYSNEVFGIEEVVSDNILLMHFYSISELISTQTLVEKFKFCIDIFESEKIQSICKYKDKIYLGLGKLKGGLSIYNIDGTLEQFMSFDKDSLINFMKKETGKEYSLSNTENEGILIKVMNNTPIPCLFQFGYGGGIIREFLLIALGVKGFGNYIKNETGVKEKFNILNKTFNNVTFSLDYSLNKPKVNNLVDLFKYLSDNKINFYHLFTGSTPFYTDDTNSIQLPSYAYIQITSHNYATYYALATNESEYQNVYVKNVLNDNPISIMAPNDTLEITTTFNELYSSTQIDCKNKHNVVVRIQSPANQSTTLNLETKFKNLPAKSKVIFLKMNQGSCTANMTGVYLKNGFKDKIFNFGNLNYNTIEFYKDGTGGLFMIGGTFDSSEATPTSTINLMSLDTPYYTEKMKLE